jgi:glycerol uptake facilitator protein
MNFTKTQEFIAEFLGTMVLILFGCGSVAMVALFATAPDMPGEVVKGGYTNIVLGWGLAVTMGIYISGTISGAHLNPAVTLAFATTGRFPWAKSLHYIIAQLLGAFAGAALVYAVYRSKWLLIDPDFESTAKIFATFPEVPGFLSGWLDQIVGTALLVGLILAVVDKFNAPPGSNLAPLVIGLIVVAIGISFGGMHGYAINPARDLGPRLFAVAAGFKNNGLTDGTGVWLVPVFCPLIGGVIGALVYDALIGRTLLRANAVRMPASGMDPSHHDPAAPKNV